MKKGKSGLPVNIEENWKGHLLKENLGKSQTSLYRMPSLLIVTNVFEAAGPFGTPVPLFNPHAVTMREHVLILIAVMYLLLVMCIVTHVFTDAASERGYIKIV
jgi:hypothetical protein